MNNKYVYSYCDADSFPNFFTIVAKSYNDAVNKLIQKFVEKYDDDNKITDIDNFEDLQEYLWGTYTVLISDLVDVEDL